MAVLHESGGVFSFNRDIFHHNFEKDIWSRVLIRAGAPQGFMREVAIQITPTGGWEDKVGLQYVREKHLNVYHPSMGINNRYTSLLPKEVYRHIDTYLGPHLRDFLVDKDILSMVDFGVLLKEMNRQLHDDTITKGVKFARCELKTPCRTPLIGRLLAHPELYEPPARLLQHYHRDKVSR